MRGVSGKRFGVLLVAGSLVLAGCGEGAETEASAAADIEADAAGVPGGDGGLGQVVTDDWDWSARTDGQIDELPFPVFPESRLSSFMADLEPGEPQALTLQTGAPLDEVVAFYAAELDGYNQREQYGTHLFWQGAASFDPMEDTDVANVQVRSAISSDSTFISMFFPPAGS